MRLLIGFAVAAILSAECLPPEGERITVGQLAATNPEFEAIPAETPVGYAPAPGARRIFRREELRRIAGVHGVELPSPQEVCFEWALRVPEKEAILAAMHSALRLPEARIEMIEQSRYPAPEGELVFPKDGISGRNGAQPALWRGYVQYGGVRKFGIWARVKIVAPVRRVVAISPLKPGQPIQEQQVRIETGETFPDGEYAASMEEVVGYEPRRWIAAGAAIGPHLLQPAKEVSRGEAVRVEVKSGPLRITGEGLAEADGRRGEMIPVRNASSGKSFQARVESKGKVVVEN